MMHVQAVQVNCPKVLLDIRRESRNDGIPCCHIMCTSSIKPHYPSVSLNDSQVKSSPSQYLFWTSDILCSLYKQSQIRSTKIEKRDSPIVFYFAIESQVRSMEVGCAWRYHTARHYLASGGRRLVDWSMLSSGRLHNWVRNHRGLGGLNLVQLGGQRIHPNALRHDSPSLCT